MTPRQLIRSVLAIFAGLMVISLLVEALEFALVTAVQGEANTDPEVYFGTRNRPWFLALKLVYNTAGAAVGGFLAARIAGVRPLQHGVALAIVQTVAFAYALSQPEISRWTPGWVWAALIVLSFAGILLGAKAFARRSSTG